MKLCIMLVVMVLSVVIIQLIPKSSIWSNFTGPGLSIVAFCLAVWVTVDVFKDLYAPGWRDWVNPRDSKRKKA